MSTINSEQFTTIEIGNFPKELQKSLLNNLNNLNPNANETEDSLLSHKLDFKKELTTLENRYISFLDSFIKLNKNFDELLKEFHRDKFEQINSNFQNLKKRIVYIHENLELLQDSSLTIAGDEEIKNLLANIKSLHEQIQKEQNEVSNKSKLILDENKFLLQKNNEIEFQADEESIALEEEEAFNLDKEISLKKNDLRKMKKYSEEIQKLTSEIQNKINNQGGSIEENKSLTETRTRSSHSISIKLEEVQIPNRTNIYLVIWCLGSVLILVLLILLKYVVTKSSQRDLK